MDAKGAKTEAKKLALLDFVIFPNFPKSFLEWEAALA